MADSDKSQNEHKEGSSQSSNASNKIGPLGDAGFASTPISPGPDDVSFYESSEWDALEPADRQALLEPVKEQFFIILEEVESIGDGAAEESLTQGRRRKVFKVGLITFTGLIAIANFLGSFFNDYSKTFALVSGLLAILVATLGSVDSFFGFGEKSLSLMELHYRCRDVVINLRARWAVAVLPARPDFKAYRNAFRALDAAQREIQQINGMAKRVMHDGEGRSNSSSS